MSRMHDDGLVAHMRAQIAEYREARKPLAAAVAALQWSFSMGSERLRRTQEMLDEPLVFLDAVIASGGDHSSAVDKALGEIDGALRRVFEQYAA